MDVPYLKKPHHLKTEILLQDIADFFGICDSGWKSDKVLFREMSICSGEALLHPDLPVILDKLCEYRRFYEELRLSTNLTLVPKKEIIEAAHHYNAFGKTFIFMLNDYGEISKKSNEIVELLKSENLQYSYHKYYSEDQYCGGWIDLKAASRNDKFTAISNFSNCRFSTLDNGCPAIYSGYFFPCSVSCRHYLDDVTQADQHPYEILKLSHCRNEIAKQSAFKYITTEYRANLDSFEGCYLCNGYDSVKSPRIPAAEQI
jgi:hypothetical protein